MFIYPYVTRSKYFYYLKNNSLIYLSKIYFINLKDEIIIMRNIENK